MKGCSPYPKVHNFWCCFSGSQQLTNRHSEISDTAGIHCTTSRIASAGRPHQRWGVGTGRWSECLLVQNFMHHASFRLNEVSRASISLLCCSLQSLPPWSSSVDYRNLSCGGCIESFRILASTYETWLFQDSRVHVIEGLVHLGENVYHRIDAFTFV